MLADLRGHAEVAAWMRRHFCRRHHQALAQGKIPADALSSLAASQKEKAMNENFVV